MVFTGLLLVQRLNQRLERPHEKMSRELASLHLTILDLQEAITELKEGRYIPPRRSALRSVRPRGNRNLISEI